MCCDRKPLNWWFLLEICRTRTAQMKDIFTPFLHPVFYHRRISSHWRQTGNVKRENKWTPYFMRHKHILLMETPNLQFDKECAWVEDTVSASVCLKRQDCGKGCNNANISFRIKRLVRTSGQSQSTQTFIQAAVTFHSRWRLFGDFCIMSFRNKRQFRRCASFRGSYVDDNSS